MRLAVERLRWGDPHFSFPFKDFGFGQMPRPEAAKGIIDFCKTHMQSRGDPAPAADNAPAGVVAGGELNSPQLDSFTDLANARAPVVNAKILDYVGKLQSVPDLPARIKADPKAVLSGMRPDHKYKWGASFGDFINQQIDDAAEYFTHFFDCFSFHLYGACWKFSWKPPFVYVDLFTGYRWPVHALQMARNGWENVHIPKFGDFSLTKLMAKASDALVMDTNIISLLISNGSGIDDINIAKGAVKVAFAALNIIPGLNYPSFHAEETYNPGHNNPAVDVSDVFRMAKSSIKDGPFDDIEFRWQKTNRHGSDGAEATTTRSWIDFFLAPIFSHIPLIGLHHNLKRGAGPLYWLMPASTKGGIFFPAFEPISRTITGATVTDPIGTAKRLAMSLGCNLFDGQDRGPQQSSLQSPADLLLPVPKDKIQPVLRRIPGYDAISKWCGRGNQNFAKQLSSTDHGGNMITSLEKSGLRGTYATNSFIEKPALALGLSDAYYHIDNENLPPSDSPYGNKVKHHDDRTLFMSKGALAENVFDTDHACQGFYSGTMRFGREPGKNGQRGFRLDMQTENFPKKSDTGSGKNDLSWSNATLHKRFIYCKYTRFHWCGFHSCPSNITN